MSAVAGPSSRPIQLQQSQQNVQPWEFTRRKCWADLLMTELSEAIVLVLSSRRKVLFCNPAVREILGWQDEDLIDSDFKDLVNGLYLIECIAVFPALICDLRPSERQTRFLRNVRSHHRAS